MTASDDNHSCSDPAAAPIPHQTHDDLLGSDQKPNVWRFCAPVFIGPPTGLFLGTSERLHPRQGKDTPDLRNGTLTFVRHENHVFALTCAHVVDALHKINRAEKAWLDRLCGADTPYPSEVQHRFLFPAGDRSIDVNIQFVRCPEPNVDLAYGWMPPEIYTAIGREALDIGLDHELPEAWPIEAGALACGYPETNRNIHQGSRRVSSFGIEAVTLRTSISRPLGRSLRMTGEIDEATTKSVDVLSGMSGGPILVTCDDRWGVGRHRFLRS